MSQALVRFPDDTYVEYFFDSTHGVYGDLAYPSTENLLSYGDGDRVINENRLLMTRGGYAPDEILPLNAYWDSWVLAVGLNYDSIFYGSNVGGNVLIQGDYDPYCGSQDSGFFDIAQIVQGAFLPDDNQGFREYGEIINSPSWRSVAPFLLDRGILPNLPLNAPLDPIQTSEGWVYWRMIWS